MLSFRRFTEEENMKTQVLCLVGVLSLLLVSGSALAQNTIVANVPFSFSVNRTTMPAGEYRISSVGTGDTLLIQSRDMKAAKLFIPISAGASKPSADSKLVFHCYDNREHCFLYQIWVQGKERGRQVPKSSYENEVAARLRSNDVPVIASAR
jgi:hypothetical protein